MLVAGPATSWAAHLLLSYALVPPACDATTLPLHLATATFALAAVASVLVGVRGLDHDHSRPRAAMVLGGIFVLAIMLQGAANAMVDPCA